MDNLFPFQVSGSPSRKMQLYYWQALATIHNGALLALYVAIITLVVKALA